MHHPRAEHLEPAALAPNVDFGRRFGKREIRWPESHFQVVGFEESPQELVQDALEVGEAHVFTHHESLDLMEHGGMGLVGVAPVDTAGRDDPERRLAGLHDPYLHRRGVSAQQPPVGKVERVLHGSRGMVRGNVERFEVVIVVLEFGSFHDLESDRAKQRRDSLEGAGDRMQTAAPLTAPR